MCVYLVGSRLRGSRYYHNGADTILTPHNVCPSLSSGQRLSRVHKCRRIIRQPFLSDPAPRNTRVYPVMMSSNGRSSAHCHEAWKDNAPLQPYPRARLLTSGARSYTSRSWSRPKRLTKFMSMCSETDQFILHGRPNQVLLFETQEGADGLEPLGKNPWSFSISASNRG